MDLPKLVSSRKQVLSGSKPVVPSEASCDGALDYSRKEPAHISHTIPLKDRKEPDNPPDSVPDSTSRNSSSKKSKSKPKPESQCTRSNNSNGTSYIITLKVKVTDMALQSGQFRQSHRERRPTEKMRQLRESSDMEDLVPKKSIGLCEDEKEQPPRQTTVTKSKRKATIRSRKIRRPAQSMDADYKCPARYRHQRGRQNITDTVFPVENTPGLFCKDNLELRPEDERELTLDDFEVPTTYGFPLRVMRNVDGKIQEPQSKVNPHFQLIGPQERVLHDNQSQSVIRRAVLPNTLEFWMDWFMAEQASKSSNLDFKLMCLNLMKLRAQAEIPKITVNNPLTQGQGIYFFGRRVDRHDSSTMRSHQSMRSVLPPYGVDCRKDSDDSSILLTFTDWDVLLASIKIARQDMYRRRRWRLKGKFNEAGWAVWETRMRRESRGSFVEDNPATSRPATVIRQSDKRSGQQRDPTIMQGVDEVVVERWWMSLSTKATGYRRRGIDTGSGQLAYPTGSHWEDITPVTMTTGSGITQHTSSKGEVSDVRRFIRSMANGQRVVEKAVEEDGVTSDEDWSRSLPNVRRKLFTAETFAGLNK